MGREDNVFSVFEDKITPRKKNKSIQSVYDYEKHYMELISRYKGEIEFIANMLKDYRAEQIKFFEKQLPEISQKLDKENVDEDMKKAFMNKLTENMNRSFAISEKLITNYTTKKIDEFKNIVNEKLHSM